MKQIVRIITKYIELFPYLLVGNGSNFNVFTATVQLLQKLHKVWER